jgi:RNA recognition motif-containing protein
VSIGKRVWVGNLNFETTWQDLKDHFKQAGPVIRADIMEVRGALTMGCGGMHVLRGRWVCGSGEVEGGLLAAV